MLTPLALMTLVNSIDSLNFIDSINLVDLFDPLILITFLVKFTFYNLNLFYEAVVHMFNNSTQESLRKNQPNVFSTVSPTLYK